VWWTTSPCRYAVTAGDEPAPVHAQAPQPRAELFEMAVCTAEFGHQEHFGARGTPT
jgi:hypothetical protein